MTDLEVAKRIAEEVAEAGGRTYYVGGCVRDELLHKTSKDIDIEVYGISPEQLRSICRKFGKVDEVGMSFGILKIHGYDIDISMPRKERLTGVGHKSFDVEVDPYMDEKTAAMRRDFTINAIMKNVLTGEYVDSFSGIDDLKNHEIRHISDDTFVEDPLRVFRAAGFAARLNFHINQNTFNLCKSIDVSSLSNERIFEETNKVLLKADTPSIYFQALKGMSHLKEFFPEVESLIGLPQDPEKHPEGDVWNHTMCVLDNAAKVKSKSKHQLEFMYAALFHDIGKKDTTTFENGKWRSLKHDIAGIEKSKKALLKITNDKKLILYVQNMVSLHMKPHMTTVKSAKRTINGIIDRSVCPEDLILLSVCDKQNRRAIDDGYLKFWDEKIKEYRALMLEPEVTGKDLIELGYVPGPMFAKIIAKCHQIHLSGCDKETILKSLPNIIEGIKEKEERSR